MAEPHFGIIIRADGTVPFDDDLHPDHKRAIIGHLVEMGHELEHHPQGKHVRLKSGPHAPKRHP